MFNKPRTTTYVETLLLLSLLPLSVAAQSEDYEYAGSAAGSDYWQWQTVRTMLGTGKKGYNNGQQRKQEVQLHSPLGMTWAPYPGYTMLWFSDGDIGGARSVVRACDMDDMSVQDILGSPYHTGTTDSPPLFTNITAMAYHATRFTLYMLDQHSVRTAYGTVEDFQVTTIAGSVDTPGSSNGNGQGCRFHHPQGLALAVTNNGDMLYIADTENHLIRVVDPATGQCGVVAGSGEQGCMDGPARAATFGLPTGIVYDKERERLYISDRGCQAVRVLDFETQMVTSLISASTVKKGQGAAEHACNLVSPGALKLDPRSSQLFIADGGSRSIYSADVVDGVCYTIVGLHANPHSGGIKDMTISDQLPALLVSMAQLLFIDAGNHRIRAVKRTPPAPAEWPSPPPPTAPAAPDQPSVPIQQPTTQPAAPPPLIHPAYKPPPYHIPDYASPMDEPFPSDYGSPPVAYQPPAPDTEPSEMPEWSEESSNDEESSLPYPNPHPNPPPPEEESSSDETSNEEPSVPPDEHSVPPDEPSLPPEEPSVPPDEPSSPPEEPSSPEWSPGPEESSEPAPYPQEPPVQPAPAPPTIFPQDPQQGYVSLLQSLGGKPRVKDAARVAQPPVTVSGLAATYQACSDVRVVQTATLIDGAVAALIMLGSSSVAIPVGSNYIDNGVTVVTSSDIGYTVTARGLPVNTNVTTNTAVPLNITYTAVFMDGTRLKLTRRVRVMSTSSPSSLIPPTITLVQNDMSAPAVDNLQTPLGVLTKVLMGTSYSDLGFSAVDAQGNDISSFVQVCGSNAIPTAQPTAPGTAFLITYTVAVPKDGYSLHAAACRLVSVVCPGNTQPCAVSQDSIDSQTGTQWACPVNGVCQPGLSLLSASTQAWSQPVSGDTTASSVTGPGDPSTWNVTPIVTLLGLDTVTISQGHSYTVCASDPDNNTAGLPRMSEEKCDPGAVASLTLPNMPSQTFDVSNLLVACRYMSGLEPPATWADSGLQYCQLNTSQPGQQTITYSLVYGSAKQVASASRTILIAEECDTSQGEFVCPGTGRCSVALVCDGPGNNNNSHANANTQSTIPAGLLSQQTSNKPPNMTLVTSPPYATQVMRLTLGQTLQPCSTGQIPTANNPCDPGVTVKDFRGLDITSQVLVCPSASCLNGTGSCTGHWLSAITNISDACGISVVASQQLSRDNATAILSALPSELAVAEQMSDRDYPVTYVVYDSQGLSATVTRVVRIAQPCSSGTAADGSCYISEDAGTQGMLQMILNQPGQLVNTPPHMQLVLPPPGRVYPLQDAILPSSQAGANATNATYYIPFGVPGLLHIQPCPAWNDTGNCAVIATDDQDGDVSSRVMLQDVTPCPDSATGQLCRCSPAGLLAGSCLPGRYIYNYTVVDFHGLHAAEPLHITVQVERLLEYTLPIMLQTASPQQAEEYLEAIKSSSGYSNLLAAVLAEMMVPDLDMQSIRSVTVIDAQITTWNTVTGSSAMSQANTTMAMDLKLVAADLGSITNEEINNYTATMKYVAAMSPASRRRHLRSLQASLQSSMQSTDATQMPQQPLQGQVANRLLQQVTDWPTYLCGDSVPPWLILAVLPANQSIDLPGLGTFQGIRQLSDQGNTLQPSCLTRPTSESDLLTASAMTSIDALNSAAMQMMSQLQVLESTAWPQQSVLDVLDAADSDIAADLMTWFQDSATASDDLSNRLADTLATFQEAVVANQAGLLAAAQLGATQLDSMFATYSMKNAMTTFLNTDMILESLGLSTADQQASTGDDEFTACLLSRGTQPQYTFKIRNHAPGGGSEQGTSTTPTSQSGAEGGVAMLKNDVSLDAADQPHHKRSLLTMNGVGSYGGGFGAVGSNGGSASGSSDTGGTWDGYMLMNDVDIQYDLIDLKGVSPDRWLGTGRSNNLLGGLLLHQVRGPQHLELDRSSCMSRFGHLVYECDNKQSEQVYTGTEHSKVVNGIGTDAVFDTNSQLFNADLKVSDWYNTSHGSEELNAAGLPYGFFHDSLQGFADGYPVWISNGLPMHRAMQLITYLSDGGYLSPDYTRTLEVYGVVYNPQLSVFGILDARFSWSPSGSIAMNVLATAIPAMAYQGHITTENWQQFVPTLLLVLTTAIYIPLTLSDLVVQVTSKHKVWQLQQQQQQLAESQKEKAKGTAPHQQAAITNAQSAARMLQKQLGRRRAKSMFWIIFEAVHCCVLFAAVIMLFVYVFELSATVRLKDSYEVYDADQYAPARFLLPKREISVSAGMYSNNVTAGASNRPNKLLRQPRPGEPGRWRLEASQSDGMQEVAAMMNDVQRMWNIFALYTLLQSVVMLMLVIRLVAVATAQPRLRVIALTLGRALPDVLHLVVGPMTVSVVLLGALTCIIFYASHEDASSFWQAVLLWAQMVIQPDDSMTVLSAALKAAQESGNALELALAWILCTLGVAFVFLLLSIQIMSMLLHPYSVLRQAASHQPTLAEDVVRRLLWQLQVWREGAPSNTHITKVLALLLKPQGKKGWKAAVQKLGKLQLLSKSIAGKGYDNDESKHSDSSGGHMPGNRLQLRQNDVFELDDGSNGNILTAIDEAPVGVLPGTPRATRITRTPPTAQMSTMQVSRLNRAVRAIQTAKTPKAARLARVRVAAVAARHTLELATVEEEAEDATEDDGQNMNEAGITKKPSLPSKVHASEDKTEVSTNLVVRNTSSRWRGLWPALRARKHTAYQRQPPPTEFEMSDGSALPYEAVVHAIQSMQSSHSSAAALASCLVTRFGAANPTQQQGSKGIRLSHVCRGGVCLGHQLQLEARRQRLKRRAQEALIAKAHLASSLRRSSSQQYTNPGRLSMTRKLSGIHVLAQQHETQSAISNHENPGHGTFVLGVHNGVVSLTPIAESEKADQQATERQPNVNGSHSNELLPPPCRAASMRLYIPQPEAQNLEPLEADRSSAGPVLMSVSSRRSLTSVTSSNRRALIRNSSSMSSRDSQGNRTSRTSTQLRALLSTHSGNSRSTATSIAASIASMAIPLLSEEERQTLKSMLQEDAMKRRLQDWQKDTSPDFYEQTRLQRQQQARQVPTGRSIKRSISLPHTQDSMLNTAPGGSSLPDLARVGVSLPARDSATSMVSRMRAAQKELTLDGIPVSDAPSSPTLQLPLPPQLRDSASENHAPGPIRQSASLESPCSSSSAEASPTSRGGRLNLALIRECREQSSSEHIEQKLRLNDIGDVAISAFQLKSRTHSKQKKQHAVKTESQELQPNNGSCSNAQQLVWKAVQECEDLQHSLKAVASEMEAMGKNIDALLSKKQTRG